MSRRENLNQKYRIGEWRNSPTFIMYFFDHSSLFVLCPRHLIPSRQISECINMCIKMQFASSTGRKEEEKLICSRLLGIFKVQTCCCKKIEINLIKNEKILSFSKSSLSYHLCEVPRKACFEMISDVNIGEFCTWFIA